MPGILLGYHVGLGGKWAGDYLVTPLQDWQPENAGGTLRIFRIKEIVIDSTRQVQFPLSPVKEHMERTLGPHGESTTVKLVGIDEPVKLSNKEPTKCVYLSDGDAEGATEDAQRDEGAGVRKRYASTTRPPGIPTQVWKKMGKADKDECVRLAEVADGKHGRAASSKSASDPPAAMVQPGISADCAFGGPWPFPGKSLPDYRPAHTRRDEDSTLDARFCETGNRRVLLW